MKNGIHRLLLCASVGVIIGCAQPSVADLGFSGELVEAESIRRSGNLVEARRRFDTLRRRYTNELEAHLGYQRAMQAANLETPLVEEYQRLLAKQPSGLHYYLLGRLLHDPPREEELYREGLQLHPSSSLLLTGFAEALYRQRRFLEALAAYSRILTSEPTNMFVHLEVISIMGELGRAADINDRYCQVDMADTEWERHLLCGAALVETWDLLRAARHLERSAELNPGKSITFRILGRIYGLLGREEEAIAAYEEALVLDPGEWKAMIALGLFLCYIGESERGVQLCERAAVIAPCTPKATRALANAYRTMGRGDEATALLKETIRLDPNNLDVLLRLATQCILDRDYLSLEKYSRMTIELDPANADAHWYLVMALSSQGRDEEAKRQSERAKAVEQTNENSKKGVE